MYRVVPLGTVTGTRRGGEAEKHGKPTVCVVTIVISAPNEIFNAKKVHCYLVREPHFAIKDFNNIF